MSPSERDLLRDLISRYRRDAQNMKLGKQLRDRAKSAVEALTIFRDRVRSGRDFNQLFRPVEKRLRVIQGGKS